MKLKKEDMPSAPQPGAAPQHQQAPASQPRPNQQPAANTSTPNFSKQTAQQPTVVTASNNSRMANTPTPFDEIGEKDPQVKPAPAPEKKKKELWEMDPFGADDDPNFVFKKRSSLPFQQQQQEPSQQAKMEQLAQMLGINAGQPNDRTVQPYQPNVRPAHPARRRRRRRGPRALQQRQDRRRERV